MTRSHTSTRRRERARKTVDVAADKTMDATPTAMVATDPAPVSGTTAVGQAQRSSAAVRGPSAPPRPATKLALIIAALRSEDGASIAGLAELTGWKTNSVRGVLAGTLKAKFGLTITSTKTDGARIYRAAPDAEG